MDWAAGIGIGAIVGIAGGLWLLLSLISIRDGLTNKKGTVWARIGALLTLPTFEGGSTWLGHSLLASIFVKQTIIAYLYTSLLFIIAINVIPCLRLISWAADRIASDAVP